MCGAIDPEQARRAREPSQEGKNPEHPELAKSPTVPIIPSRELLHLQGWEADLPLTSRQGAPPV